MSITINNTGSSTRITIVSISRNFIIQNWNYHSCAMSEYFPSSISNHYLEEDSGSRRISGALAWKIWISLVATMLQLKEKRPPAKTLKGLCLLGGMYWIRTSDLLLERKVLWTSWANRREIILLYSIHLP